ncbi:hypothetical protein SteCoe_17043 [Stentor coeruleus]|uniref:EF-hand domain-containing protein n=1 Tax=Stentor coeruleus TaxID=5963 RepID=A0A1R2BZR3_9CILI|nr:hypothetical protein SteCoe_17043 [Stentor coeruleus]
MELSTNERDIIEKFKKKGFNHLTLEDLAVVQQSATWAETFKSQTNEDWISYAEKATERLNRANFNIKWVSKSKSSYSGLFSSVSRGDASKLLEFLRVSDINACKKAVDSNQKNAMHVAARDEQLEILKILVEKGWEIDVRDKHMTTPLHQACNMGHGEIASYLLEVGANPELQDTLGRNALMYGACAPSSDVCRILLGKNKGLVESKDYTGRTTLHYSVFNPHSRQTEIMKILVEAGVKIDVMDEEQKTPLHHACEAGKTKAIRWLIKWGANVGAKTIDGKSVYDLAVNINVKKLLGLCTMDNKNMPRTYSEPVVKEAAEKITNFRINERNASYKDKLMGFLYQVQEAGILNKQHIKKPQLYTGNWMEGVLSPIALFNELSYCLPSEAVMKVFNIIFPYSKPIPSHNSSEIIMDEFFGSSKVKNRNEIPIFIPDETQARKITKELETYKKNYSELQILIESKEKNIQKLETSLKAKDFEIEKLKQQLFQLTKKYDDLADELSKKQTPSYIEDKLAETKILQSKAEKRVQELYEINIRLEKELDHRPTKEQLEDAKDQIEKLHTDNMNLRFKAGKMFLKYLECNEEAVVVNGQLCVQDLEILKRLEKELKAHSPGIRQRLIDVDGNKDQKISKAEASKVLSSLNLPPQDIISLLRILGYRQGNSSVHIDKFVEILQDLDEKSEALKNELFYRLSCKFKENSLGIEHAFEYLDINHDGIVSFAEFSEGVDGLKINLNREDKHALFAVLDADHNGSILLLELKEMLEKNFEPRNKRNKEQDKNMSLEIENKNVSLEIENKRTKEEVKGVMIHKNKDQLVNKNVLVEERKYDKMAANKLETRITPQDYSKKVQAATKIQAFYRGHLQRKNFIPQVRGKVIAKCVKKDKGVRYMIFFIENLEGIVVYLYELSMDHPFYDAIDRKNIQKTSVEELLSKVSVENRKIFLGKIDGVEISDNEKESLVKNKLIARKVIKFNKRYYMISILDQGDTVKVAANLADDPSTPMYLQVSHIIVPKASPFDLFSTLKISPSHEISFSPTLKSSSSPQNPPTEPHSKQKSLLSRRIIKKNKRYYIISIFSQGKSIKIQANIADDNKKPMYECVSEIIIDAIPVEDVLKGLEILENHKIVINKVD